MMNTQNTPMVAITGNTYPVKDRLRGLGGVWDAQSKSWMVPADKADEAAALLVPKMSLQTTPGPGRRCWECGRHFTRSSMSSEGDWSDSYCGC